MDLLSCWYTGPIHRYYRSRGYSKWDDDEMPTCGNRQSSSSLSNNTGASLSMVDIVQSDTLLTLDDTLLPLLESDIYFRKVYEFLCSEKCYLNELCCALDVNADPLRKMQSLSPEEVRILFSDLELLVYCIRDLCAELRCAITKWDRNSTQIGHLFNCGFWSQYEVYCSHYIHISRLVVNKRSTNSEFAEFCDRTESMGKLSLDSLLNMPMQRLASYASELKEMALDLDSSNPDAPLLVQSANESNRLIKLRKSDGNENYLKQIQEHFPQDDLRLTDREVQCSAGNRWRSSVTKSLIGGGLKKTSMLGSSSSVGSLQSPSTRCTVSDPQLILDSAAKLVVGIHSRERHLFLFSDFLVVAKGRFDTNFRLKNKIMTSNIWVTSCSEKALVIGWPLHNSTFVFECSYHRDLWLVNLKETIKTEKAKEVPQSTQIKIIKKDYEYTAIKSLLVANNEMASQVVQRCLDEFHILDATAADFQLCVASTEDETTFSLSGHEYPFTIWMNSSQASAEGSSDVKIQFILRSNKKVAHRHIIGESNKPVRKGRVLKRLFKRPSTKQGHLKLFERELSELCEQNAAIPFPVMQILRKLYVDGPRSDGVFRKSANHAKLIAVKQSLDCGESVNFNEIPVPMAAVLLKEFLRNLPNCLLNCQMYHEWMRTALIPSHEEQISNIKQLVQLLPPCNQLLLQLLVCVLCNLAKHSEECKMNSSNLAICIGQSLLWPGNSTVVQKEDAQNANVLVQQMIDSAEDIFGPDCLTGTLLTNAAVIKRPTQMVLRGVSADSDSRQSSGATEDSVCNSLDYEFTRSCSEADYSPIVPDKAGFKLQNSQSCDSGLQLGDEGPECRGRLSASKMPRSAKVQYYTSSESREEDDCKQVMPKKLRHCKKKPAPGIPILQQSSSVDTLSSIQSAESLHLHSIESPHNESIDTSLVSFSDVLPTESFLDPPVVSSKRMLFFQSLLHPPANPFNLSLDQLADTFPPASKTVKSQKKLSTNDSGVSFLGSLNNNSEEISDAEHGRDAGNVFQKNQPPTVEVSLEQEHCSAVSMPSTFVQWNLSGGGSRQFDQARFRPPPLSDLHGTTFAEGCPETPEELKEDEFEYAKGNNAASSADSAFTSEGFSLDSGDHVLGERCLGSYLNQKSPCLLSSDSSWPDAPTNTTVEEKESRQQDSLPRRPLIRADAVESDPEKLQQGMTAAWSGMSSQLKNYLHDQPSVSGCKQPVLYSSTSVNPVGEKLSAMSSESSTPIAVDSSYEQMPVQNSSVDNANLCDPVYKEMTLEKAKVLLHHHKPSEQHLTSSVRKFLEEYSGREQLIPHCKSLDNVSMRTDSKNSIHLEQSKSPSHDSLVPNKIQTQEMREAILTESELSKCKDISNSHHHAASLKDISQHIARRRPFMDNRMENTSTHASKSKQFSEIRSFYDQCREKGSGSLPSAEVVSEGLSSSIYNIRPRLTKKRSKNRYLRKRNSDPRLNVEGKGGSDLGRSKSDSSERYRNSKRVLQANLRRSEIERSKENFNALETDLLQKTIERSGKSVSAKDLSASVRSTIHHSENVKRKSVTIKDREWHKELARQYVQSAHSSVDLSPSRKSDLSSTAYRFGREVDKNLNREATGDHGCTGRSHLDRSSHLSKASSAGEIFLNDKLTGDVFDDSFKDSSQHTSKPSQKISLISSSLTSSVVKPHHPDTKEVPHVRSLKLSNTRVRELRENFLGLPLNSDTSKVPDSCSRTYISSLSAHDSAMISKSSRQPLHESVGRIMDDAKLLDPANISWSVAQLKELFSTQHSDSTNTRARMSHSKSEDWSPSTKVSALPRLG